MANQIYMTPEVSSNRQGLYSLPHTVVDYIFRGIGICDSGNNDMRSGTKQM